MEIHSQVICPFCKQVQEKQRQTQDGLKCQSCHSLIDINQVMNERTKVLGDTTISSTKIAQEMHSFQDDSPNETRSKSGIDENDIASELEHFIEKKPNQALYNAKQYKQKTRKKTRTEVVQAVKKAETPTKKTVAWPYIIISILVLLVGIFVFSGSFKKNKTELPQKKLLPNNSKTSSLLEKNKIEKNSQKTSPKESLKEPLNKKANKAKIAHKRIEVKNFVKIEFPKLVAERKLPQLQKQLSKLQKENKTNKTLVRLQKELTKIKLLLGLLKKRITKGRNVKIHTRDEKILTGKILSITKNSFTIQTSEEPKKKVVVAFSDLTALNLVFLGGKKTREKLYYIGRVLFCEGEDEEALKFLKQSYKLGYKPARKLIKTINRVMLNKYVSVIVNGSEKIEEGTTSRYYIDIYNIGKQKIHFKLQVLLPPTLEYVEKNIGYWEADLLPNKKTNYSYQLYAINPGEKQQRIVLSVARRKLRKSNWITTTKSKR